MAAHVVVVVWCALALFGGLRLCTAEPDALFASVTVDDALYYLVPAQHLVAGEGFSFDGIHRSSGVHPLWAMVAVAISAVVRDPVLAVRVLCASAGALWIGAGIVLYLSLRRLHHLAALLTVSMWLLTGFWRHLAFTGMDNGLHALLLSLVVAYVVRLQRGSADTAAGRALGARSTPLRYLTLGALVGLFALSRTESALCAALVGLGILLGRVRLARPAGPGLQWRAALWFSLPVVLLLGGWALCSLCYFGALTPVSGDVKLLYGSQWGDLHGGFLPGVWWHVSHVFRIGSWALLSAVGEFLGRLGLPASQGVLEVVCASLLALCGVLCAWRPGSGRAPVRPRPEPSAATWLWGILAAYALAHLVLIGTLLAHYTDYGSWYFAAEIMLLQIALSFGLCCGLRAVRLGSAATLVLAALNAILLLENYRVVKETPPEDVVLQQFTVAARFLDESLPAGRRIGCLSAGVVSYLARRHTIVNLDGLMNDHEYLEEYLRKDRVPEYMRREGLHYFADYQPIAAWSRGITWCGNVPLADLALVKWWRLDNDLAYCVFRLWPDRAARDWPRDPLSELQFRAEVLGDYRLVDNADDVGPEELVATSIACLPSGTLRHVVMTAEEYRQLGFDGDSIPAARRVGARFGDELCLCAVEIARPRVKRGGRIVVTCWWEVLGGLGRPAIELALDDVGHPSDDRSARLAHGTLEPGELPAGTVIAETRSLAVGAAGKPRAVSVWVSVLGSDGSPLLPSGGAEIVRRGPAVLLGTVQIVR